MNIKKKKKNLFTQKSKIQVPISSSTKKPTKNNTWKRKSMVGPCYASCCRVERVLVLQLVMRWRWEKKGVSCISIEKREVVLSVLP